MPPSLQDRWAWPEVFEQMGVDVVVALYHSSGHTAQMQNSTDANWSDSETMLN